MIDPSGFSRIIRDQRRYRVPQAAVIVGSGVVMAVGTPRRCSQVTVPGIVRGQEITYPAKRCAAVFGIVMAVIARTALAYPVCAPDASV